MTDEQGVAAAAHRTEGDPAGDHFGDISRYQSVTTWLSSLPGTPSLRARQLGILRRFCAAAGSDPDAMIARGLGSRDAKLEAMRRLHQWAEAETSRERERHDLQNVVRSFFITNGLRVLTKPYPDVYGRSAVSPAGSEQDKTNM